jgi:hypothetical protein
MAGWTGLEPATSGLTGQRSNQTELPPQQNFAGQTFESKVQSKELKVKGVSDYLNF